MGSECSPVFSPLHGLRTSRYRGGDAFRCSPQRWGIAPHVERVRNRLGGAGTWRERFAVLDDELGALVIRELTAGPPPAVVNAWRLLHRSR